MKMLKRDTDRHNTKVSCQVYLCQTPTVFWRIHKQQDSQLSLCDGCFHPDCNSLEKNSTCHLCWEYGSRDEAWRGGEQFRLSHYHCHCQPQTNNTAPLYMSAQPLTCVSLFGTPCSVACQALPSIGFSPDKLTRVCCHFLLHWDLPNPRVKPVSPALVDVFLFTLPPGKSISIVPFSYLAVLGLSRGTLDFCSLLGHLEIVVGAHELLVEACGF